MAAPDLGKAISDLVNSYVEVTLRAQSNVFTAVLATLVRRNALSAEIVRTDLTRSLEELLAKAERDLRTGKIDDFEVQLTRRLVLLVQERLGTVR